MALDTTSYYRLTNVSRGRGSALDVRPDGSGLLMMAPPADVSGQYWKLVDVGGGKYALRTLYLGECFSLDVINDGKNDTPFLNATGNFTGEHWTVAPSAAYGTWRLTNDFTGPDRSLMVSPDTSEPFVGTGDFFQQSWFLTPLRKLDPPSLPPDLDPGENTDHSEGPSDYGNFARPLGSVGAVMVFVDFPDATGPPAACLPISQFLLGNGKFQQNYREQSYEKLDMEVDVRADLGWRRIQHTSAIDNTDFAQQMSYITAAVAAFPDVSFKDKIMILVPPESAVNVTPSPAFNPGKGSGVKTLSGDEVYLAVTVGQDVWANARSGVEKFSWMTLVHEVGHLFDLPDLYVLKQPPVLSKAGCWDVMSDIFNSETFLGWHRRKNGWLDPERTLYIDWSTTGWYTTLHPLSGRCGLSMVVLPIDDAKKPSKVFVIEIAPPPSDPSWGQGILIYSVDATIPSGQSPLEVFPKTPGVGPNAAGLYLAPFGVGDHAKVRVGGVDLTVDVLQKFGSSYNVKIGYSRSSSWFDAILAKVRDLFGGFVQLVRGALGLPDPSGRWPRAREPGAVVRAERNSGIQR
jgi:M6 family metalloprotease-like protein